MIKLLSKTKQNQSGVSRDLLSQGHCIGYTMYAIGNYYTVPVLDID